MSLAEDFPNLISHLTSLSTISSQLLEACCGVLQGLSSTEELGIGSTILAGGIGGVAYWGPVYPADVIKSRIQVDDLRNPQYRGMLDCFAKV